MHSHDSTKKAAVAGFIVLMSVTSVSAQVPEGFWYATNKVGDAEVKVFASVFDKAIGLNVSATFSQRSERGRGCVYALRQPTAAGSVRAVLLAKAFNSYADSSPNCPSAVDVQFKQGGVQALTIEINGLAEGLRIQFPLMPAPNMTGTLPVTLPKSAVITDISLGQTVAEIRDELVRRGFEHESARDMKKRTSRPSDGRAVYSLNFRKFKPTGNCTQNQDAIGQEEAEAFTIHFTGAEAQPDFSVIPAAVERYWSPAADERPAAPVLNDALKARYGVPTVAESARALVWEFRRDGRLYDGNVREQASTGRNCALGNSGSMVRISGELERMRKTCGGAARPWSAGETLAVAKRYDDNGNERRAADCGSQVIATMQVSSSGQFEALRVVMTNRAVVLREAWLMLAGAEQTRS